MLKRQMLSILVAMFCPFAVAAAGATPQAGGQPQNARSAHFQLSQKTEIPGKTLKSGAYTITRVDHLNDRAILRISSASGQEAAEFVGVPSTSMGNGSGAGPILWGDKAEGTTALRGFTFADGASFEFVYPKAEAVALAKANNTHVLAVDPKSEGKPDLPKLSQDDLQLVTLWLLTPTTVSPEEGKVGIAAERYHPPAAEQAAASQPARGMQPTSGMQPAASSNYTEGRASGASQTQAPRQVASARSPRPLHRPAVAALPHTASDTPLLLLVALFALLGAGALALRRMV